MTAIRKIIEIDEKKCNGCGICIPNCPEGALQIIDGKARLISDLFCDGLGACIGKCPLNAIKVIEREAEKYDESKVMENIVKAGANTIKAHLTHLKDHNETGFLNEALDFLRKKGIAIPDFEKEKEQKFCGCPGSKIVDLRAQQVSEKNNSSDAVISKQVRLNNWPIQLKLINPSASYFDNAEILIAADCSLTAHPDFNRKFLEGKILMIFCPKLDDDVESYIDKLSVIFKNHNIKSVSVIHMEVPCCFGTVQVVENALNNSGKNIPLNIFKVSISGEILN